MSDSNFQKVLVSGPVVNDDDTRSIVVQYQTDDSTTTGLGLAVSFDSSSLTLTGSSLLNSADNIAAGNESVDGDTQTVTFAWASLFGSWPGSTESDLFELTFEPVDGGGTNYDIEFATTSVAAGFTAVLPGPTAILTSPLAVTLNTIDENSGEGQVVASVDGGPSDAIYTLVDNTDYGDQPDQPDQAETVINVPAPAATTQQVYVSSSTTSEDGTQETVVISYNSDSAATTGLGLDIHFDSSKVSASDITALVGTDLLVNGSIKSDDADLDGDASTDQIVSFGWASLFGNWPGTESADLAEITFDIAEGAEGSFDLNFTASSSAAGFNFEGQNQEIAIQTVVQPPLTIDSATGDVTLNVNPDFESIENYDFIVVANSGAASEQSVSAQLTIGNLDEVAPTINSSSSVAAIDENSGAGQVIYTATADDSADASDGVTFALAVGSDSALSIDANTGAVTLADNPDYELKDQYNFSVVATDIAGLSSASLPLTLNINNVDDTAPVITSSADAGSVSENSGAGQVIYTAEATDETSDVVFSLAGDDAAAFSVDSVSGAVQLIANPDFEAKNSYSFDVVASDEAGNSSQQNVTLSVVNVDDAAPVITSGAAADGIVENSGAGQVIYTATANDGLDISDGVTYSLADGSDNALSIDSVSGEVTLSVNPDYEAQTSYSFGVVATDFAGNESSTQSVELEIINELDSKPSWLSDSVATSIDENSGAGQLVYTALAEVNLEGDSAGAEGVGITYSLSDDNGGQFIIDSATGAVNLIGDPDFEADSSYSFSVLATDDLGNDSEPKTVTLAINNLDEVAPTVASGDSAGEIDENGITQVIYTAVADDSGDTSDGVTFSLADGSDPALSINSATGEVSIAGAADHETQSTYSFAVIATDAAGLSSDAQSVTLNINDLDDAAPVVISGITAAPIDENSGSGQVIYTVNADDSFDDVSNAPITFSLKEGSDAALSINAETGEVMLNADPDHESQSLYSFSVVATDAAGNESEAESVTLDINDLDDTAPEIISDSTAAAIAENSGADQVVYTVSTDDSADVNDGTMVFSLSDDSNGLFSIDAISGDVSLAENPNFESVESYSFTVVATDGSNNASSKVVTLPVSNVDDTAPILETPEVPPTLASFSSDNQTVYVPNGTDDDSDVTSEPLTYTISVPAGLENDLIIDVNTGNVTYVPVPQTTEVLLEIPYSVTATDGAGNETSVSLQLNISGNESNVPLFDTPAGFDVSETSQVVQNEGTDYELFENIVLSVTGSLDDSVQSGDVIYVANVKDATPLTFDIKDAAPVDENSGYNQVVYTAVSTGHLSINVNSGEVTVTGTPWVAGSDQYNFTVIATDSSGNQSEQAVSLSVADYAGGSNMSEASFALAEGHDDALVIDSQTGEVKLLDNPDYEKATDYSFVVEVTNDSGVREQSVTVSVGNYDDTAPEITSGDDAGSVAENSPAGQVVYNASADDSSDVSEGSVSFSLTSDSDNALSIDEQGAVTLSHSPDHEAQSEYVFTVVAEDSAGNSSQETVTLAVNDLDEIAPTIVSADSVSVDESGKTAELIYAAASHDSQSVVEQGPISQQFVRNEDGTLTVRLFVDSSIAQDYSNGLEAINFILSYSSEEQGVLAVNSVDTPSAPLSVISNQEDGSISFAMYFTTPEFAAVATNNAEANLYDTLGNTPIAEVTFSVGSDSVVNQFTVSEAGLTEYKFGTSFPGGQSVSEYQMADSDSTVTYSLVDASDSSLSIDSATGNVYLDSALDYEAQDAYAFTVVATDAAGNDSSKEITVAVNDLDEVAPQITSGATGASVDENSGSQVIYTATASDIADLSGGVTFSLAAGSDSALTINSTTGAVTLADSPDYEAQDEYAFTVVATDAAGNSSDQAVTVAVRNLDEVSPNISVADGSVSIDENVGAEVVYTASAVDDGDVTGGFTWSLTGVDQDVFAINAITGAVTMLASPDYETKSEYSFTVVATDVSGNASEQVINLLINNLDEVAAVFTSSDTAQSINENLGAGQVVYSATVDDSADISNGITFSLSDDSDSALTIDSSTGAVSLSGNPDFEAQSAYNFTVVATDAADNVASKSVSLSVTNVDESAPTITSGDSATITENTGVNQVIYTANSTDNGDVSDGVTYSLGEGSDVALSINTVSGAVTLAKNPDFETQEEYSFTLVATDAAGNTSDSQEVTVSVVDSMIYSVTHWSSNVVLEGVNTDSGAPEKALNAEEASLAITASDALDALKLSVDLSIDSYQETDNAEMFQELSADVNGDGIISSADAYALLLRAARVENSFDASWQFVEMDQDNDSASYAGYVLGDVDGSWASSTSDPVINLQESELAGKVIFSFDAKGNTITGKDAGLSVDLGSGEISLSADADYETQSAYTFTMTNNFTGVEQNYTVSVINEDESAPVIVSSASVSLVENSGAGQVVYVAVADDSADASDGVTYALAAGSDASLSIDSESGDVTLAENPILSETAQYNFTVIVTDASGKSNEQAVTINVLPTPDSNAPVFESGASASAIDENSEVGQVIYTASASDESAVTYSLAGENAGLTIDSASGEVSLASSPDYEEQSEFSFTVVASDGVNQSTQAVTVAINDLDDVAPTITSGNANAIDENSGADQVIYTVSADDLGDDVEVAPITYSLTDDSDADLSIDSSTGEVILAVDPDADVKDAYSFAVMATDGAGNESEAQSVTVEINDLDDADPTVTSGGDAGSIDENSGAGQVIYTATADDSADISGGVTFSLSSASSDALSINANTGRVMLADNPDFESADSYDFVVVATDVAGNSSEQSVSLSINNMDETAPSISSETAVSVNENSGTGQAVYTAVASDIEDISAGVTFRLAEGSDSALNIDVVSGVVTLNDNPDQESQSEYSFTVVASDGVNQSTQVVILTINDLDEAGPEITSGDEVQVDENSGAGQVVYTATADDSADIGGGVTFALEEGSDAALSIDASTGEVTLAVDPDADAKDTYSFAVVATDAADNSSEAQSVTLTVNNLDEVAPTITSGNQAAAIDENSGSQVVYVASSSDSDDVSSGITTYSLAEGSDSSLAINAATGEVLLLTSPDHESQADYSFTVVATDAAGNASDSQSVTLSVNDLDEVSATVTSSDTANAINENSGVGQVVYTATATDDGDVSEGFTFGLSSDSDDMISINAQSGAVKLNENPNHEAQSQYSFTVVVTDAAGNVSEGHSVTLSINNLDEVAATITSSGSAGAIDENTGGNTVIYTATADDSSDISGGVTFALANGSDQALSIDPNSGEVSLANDADYEAQSTYSFIVIATDAAGNQSLGKPVTLNVNNLDEVGPTITSGNIAIDVNENSGAGQVVYTAVAADNGDIGGGVSFTLGEGSDGFAIDSASGVVTTSDDFTADAETSTEQGFTVVATDAAGNSSQMLVSLSINNLDEVAPEITSGNSINAIDENSGLGQVVYTATASDNSDVSGGYSFRLSAGSDSALSIDSVTGAVTLNTNPDFEAQSEYSFTVIATDAAGNESTGQSVTLDINNLDEVSPDITSGDYAGVIAENSGAGQVVYTATSDDTGDTSDAVTFSLSEYSDSALSIDANTGAVTLADDPNFESQSEYSFIVIATDSAGNSSSELVTLNISNADEAAPTLTSGDTASTVDENSGVGQLIYTAVADDSADVSGGVAFTLADSDAGLSIDSVTGAVTTNADFAADYEDAAEQSFTVVATDTSGFSSEKTVTFVVDNLDETSPNVTSGDVSDSIDENSGAGQVIYTATATDGDDVSGGFSFSLADGSDSAVSIDSQTGEVVLADNPDYEGQTEYSFTVVATDVAGNASVGQAVTVAINNLDEVAPVITLDSVSSDLDENSGANQLLATISADDTADISNGITYSLSADSDPALSINNATGEVILSDNPNYELKSEYSMTVVATDAAGHISAPKTISLVINNVDESAPTMTSTDTVIVVEGTGAGQVVYQAAADDSGDISDGVSYSLSESVTVNSQGSDELAENTQVVSVSDVTKSGDQLSVAVEYNADDADLTGLGLRVHFDSSELSLVGISEVLDQDFIFNDEDVKEDTLDSDGNASTDSFVHVGWASVDGSWTGEVPTDLLTVNFTVAETATGSTSIGFSASDNTVGYDFVGNSASIGFDSTDLTIDAVSGEVTLAVDPNHAAQSAYDFTVVATDAVGLTDEQQVSLNVAEVVAGASASATEAGAIEQRFVQNSDGSMTLQLFVSAATAVNYADGIENFDFVLQYDSSQVGSIVADQISAPANPFISLANDTVDGEVAVAQIYFPTPYSLSSGLPIMEVDFNLLDGVSSATFGVSGVIIGMDDVDSSSYDVSATTYAGTDDADVFALVDGVADVNSGAGSDIFVVTEDADANILVDFESGVDTLELGLLLDSAGYTGLSANSVASDQSAHQVNGNIPSIADLISDNDGSLDNAFGGYLDDSTNVLTIFTDVDSSAGSVDMQAIEVTLGEDSTIEDEDLTATFSAFIA